MRRRNVAKMKDSMHLDSGKHPFQGNGRTPKPSLGKSGAAHPKAGGVVRAGESANAVMKGGGLRK